MDDGLQRPLSYAYADRTSEYAAITDSRYALWQLIAGVSYIHFKVKIRQPRRDLEVIGSARLGNSDSCD